MVPEAHAKSIKGGKGCRGRTTGNTKQNLHRFADATFSQFQINYLKKMLEEGFHREEELHVKMFTKCEAMELH